MKIEINSLTKHILNTGNFISIDNNKCNNCGKCLLVCLLSLWRKDDNNIYLSDEYKSKCLECAACYQVCETGAINFQYPRGGTGVIYEKG
ncbi:MAG: 4Fe-4S dicluster domain-containing protein [Candidatus Hodarchaeota archaeon]